MKMSNIERIAKSLMLSLILVATAIPALIMSMESTIFLQATQNIPNFGGLTYSNGNLLICGYNKNIRIFNPSTGIFTGNAFVLPANNFSFPNDITLVPHGFSVTSFTDGRIWTILNDGSPPIQANQGQFVHANDVGFDTGLNDFTFNPSVFSGLGITGIQACQPITYRKSNGKLYTVSGFDFTNLFVLAPTGSVPTPIAMTENGQPANVGLNGFKFDAHDNLISPDAANGGRIVQINADTGVITPIITNIGEPTSLVIDNNGVWYYIDRPTATVWKRAPNQAPQSIATLLPALNSMTINDANTTLYVTNDQNDIFAVDLTTPHHTVTKIFSSPIIGPWDLGYADGLLYIADNGGLKVYNATTGQFVYKIVLDTPTSGLLGFGLVCGVDVEPGSDPNATITIADITLGDIAVLNKNQNNTVRFNYNGFVTGLFGLQTFSAVHVNAPGQTPSEYVLVTSPVTNSILQLSGPSDTPTVSTFYAGLSSPVKLKIRNGYVYVAEAGDVLNKVQNSGRISRIQLSNPQNYQVLVDHVDQPEGFDIYHDPVHGDQLLFLEVNSKSLKQASATQPTAKPTVLATNLLFQDEMLLYQYDPLEIHPLTGFACDPTGHSLFVSETQKYRIKLFQR